MPYIIVFRNDEAVMERELQEDSPLRIGRSSENDIVLPDASTSSLHAEIEYEGGFFYITDFQSRNGTFVNRELVISRRLMHDDLILIGSYNLKFIYKADEKRPAPARNAGQEATMHIDTPHHRSRLARSVGEMADRQEQPGFTGIISRFKDGLEPIFLDKPVVTIGKDPGSDITVKGWFAAKNAAEIEKKNDGYYLRPTGGRSPLVNDQPVHSEVLLKEFDMIQIGSTVMQFQYHRGRLDGSTREL